MTYNNTHRCINLRAFCLILSCSILSFAAHGESAAFADECACEDQQCQVLVCLIKAHPDDEEGVEVLFYSGTTEEQWLDSEAPQVSEWMYDVSKGAASGDEDPYRYRRDGKPKTKDVGEDDGTSPP